MTSLAERIAAIGVALIVAIVLAIGSSGYERLGPERVAYGSECEFDDRSACREPWLNGGYPLPYLFDAPGISVEGSLAFVEDEFRVVPFVLDTLVYFGAIVAAGATVMGWRRLLARGWRRA